MRSIILRNLIPIAFFALEIALGQACRAERGYVLVQVQDTAHKSVLGVEIGIDGPGGSSTLTDDHGGAKLALASSAKEGDWLSLVILHSPPGTPQNKQFVMISPWDGRSQIPSFDDKPENFIRVVVVHREDRAALEDGTVIASLTAKINKANSPHSINPQSQTEDPKANLSAVAKQYGLDPKDVDQAIRAWGAKTTDPYDAGLAALYERDYPNASSQLQNSLIQREEKLTADQKIVALDQKQVADASFFLGSSLYQQGRYRESAQVYERCLQIRSDDPLVLNETALSLENASEYVRAEIMYRRALEINEKALGSGSPVVSMNLNNLAQLLYAKGDYAGAEPLDRQALEIDEKALGPNHPDVARSLNNLAVLLAAKGDYTNAEPLYRRALAINEKAFGPDHPNVALNLGGLALLLQTKGDYAQAEPLYRRALLIDEKTLVTDHPKIALDLNNLAELLGEKGDYAEAEPMLHTAISMDTRVLGSDHPDVARDLHNLASLLYMKGDLAGADPIYRQAIAIKEKALGPDHPDLATSLNNFALLLQAKGDYAEAEPMFRRALAIRMDKLGQDHPYVATSLANLASLLMARSDYAAAEPLLRRALEIDKKALGLENSTTRLYEIDLNALLEAERQKGK